MGSVNSVFIVGHLGADPEVKHLQNNRAVCNLSVATSEQWKDKQSGEKKEKTEWHRITCFGEQAENCGKYLAKGRLVAVQGKLQTRSYDKDGQKHYATDIIADRVTFLGGGERDRDTGSQVPRGADHDTGSQVPPGDDDIPF
jgi:single-strand DNA-binding protein